MAILQHNASRLLAYLLGTLAFLIGASAPAQMTLPDRPAPPKGGFDWTRFEGKYDFDKCESHPKAVWGDYPPGAFVQIDYARTPRADGLELMRATNRSPVALGWSIERVGHGRQTETDPDTGKISKVTESYATFDGVYSMMAWERPFNVGWSTLQLRMDTRSNISFTIRQRTDSDSATREETCTLIRHIPKTSI
jgi:hypothetical protein